MTARYFCDHCKGQIPENVKERRVTYIFTRGPVNWEAPFKQVREADLCDSCFNEIRRSLENHDLDLP
jgi:hypothetical protein